MIVSYDYSNKLSGSAAREIKISKLSVDRSHKTLCLSNRVIHYLALP
jgi:hypothetical protein